MYSIGLMSGTSMDGVDAAFIETDGTPALLKPIGHTSLRYSPTCRLLFKAAEYAVRLYEGDCDLAEAHFDNALPFFFDKALALPEKEWDRQYAQLSQVLAGQTKRQVDNDADAKRITLAGIIGLSTQMHIQAVHQLLTMLGIPAAEIDVIGYHGQCLYHQPNQQISVIVGDGQMMAEALNIPVVTDFRRNDILHGGQGAPFAPLYHQALALRDGLGSVAVVNCGGISNVSFVLGQDESDLIAFDTGPGNALLDQLLRQRTQGEIHYDRDGFYGLQGKVDLAVLAQLFASAVRKQDQNYLDLVPPKSLDYGDLN